MPKGATPRPALIIPALNEEECLGTTLRRLPAGLFHTVIVADNGSSDRTAEVARNAGATVVCEPERGYGAACLRAIAALPEGIDTVVFMQADASEDAAEAALLLAPIADGRADVVIGSRTLGHADRGSLSPHQRWGNRLILWFVRLLHGRHFTDVGPFRAIRLDSLRGLGMADRNYGWTVEMQVKALRRGLRILEVPVCSHRRVAGRGKVSASLSSSLAAGAKMIWTVFRLLSYR